MYSMMMERECKGKYYMAGHFEEFERGTFLGFGIDYEEFESGPAQYTIAIVELSDGRVVVTAPDNIQFIHRRRGNGQGAPSVPVGADNALDNEIPADAVKAAGMENQRPQEVKKKKKRNRIDYGKIMALRNAGWSNEKIADEMRMTKASVATAISTYKKKCSVGGVRREVFSMWKKVKKSEKSGSRLWSHMLQKAIRLKYEVQQQSRSVGSRDRSQLRYSWADVTG